MSRIWVSFLALSLLTACGNPLDKVERIEDVELSDAPEAQAAVEAPGAGSERPILQRLFGPPPSETEPAADAPAEATPETPAAEASDPAAETKSTETPAAEAPKPRGLRGLFARRDAPAKDTPALEPEKAEAVITPAALPAEETAVVERPKRSGGLFARKNKPRTGPDAKDIAPGAPLAFGEIARVCGLKIADLGRQIERSGGGKGKYRLYDSFPNSTSQRPFYITGFGDGCPRQVTGALALFSDTGTYEHLRVHPTAKTLSTGAADKAYEKARRQTCRSKIGKACAGAKSRKLEKETAFLTVYERFGSSANWRDILLHDGSVLAMD